jgi:flagellar basal body-associated protein FliL
MADKAPPPPKPAEAPAAAPAGEAPKKKPLMKMIVMGAVVLALEGGTVGLTMMMAGGPKRVIAEPPATAPAHVEEKDVEIKLVDGKFPNNIGGRLSLVDLQVVATTPAKNKQKFTEAFTEREAQVRDRIRTIVASSDPKALAEPGLETLRRQIAYQLEQDLGKDMVKEVFIPQCTSRRVEY